MIVNPDVGPLISTNSPLVGKYKYCSHYEAQRQKQIRIITYLNKTHSLSNHKQVYYQ